MKLRFIQLIGLATLLVLVAGSPSTGGSVEGLPFVGANYSNFGRFCGGGDGIVAYGEFDRALIHRQLAAMRAAGIQTLRTFIWSTHDASGQSWGVVSSAGGRLGPTKTKNLITFVSDVRRLGFTRLTVVFGPQGRTLRSAIRTITTTPRSLTRTGSSFATFADS